VRRVYDVPFVTQHIILETGQIKYYYCLQLRYIINWVSVGLMVSSLLCRNGYESQSLCPSPPIDYILALMIVLIKKEDCQNCSVLW